VSWVFGEGIPSFPRSIVERALAGDELEAVDDKWSKPTSALDIAEASESLLAREGPGGVLHLVNEGGPESWWSCATKVVRLAREAGLLPEEPPVRRIGLEDLPQLGAPRPVHTALGSRRQEELLGAPLPSWEGRVAAELRAWAKGECH
jgi:dTDP-4-dehydrorhamnose reductase